MISAQDTCDVVQDHILDAVRKTQEATIEAVTALTEMANQTTAQLPDFAKVYEVPGYAEFTTQLPTVGKAIEANFDFAQQVLTNQREFARELVTAVTQAAD